MVQGRSSFGSINGQVWNAKWGVCALMNTFSTTQSLTCVKEDVVLFAVVDNIRLCRGAVHIERTLVDSLKRP